MPAMDSLEDPLKGEIKDIYDAEKQLTKALPKLIKTAMRIKTSTTRSPLNLTGRRSLRNPPVGRSVRGHEHRRPIQIFLSAFAAG